MGIAPIGIELDRAIEAVEDFGGILRPGWQWNTTPGGVVPPQPRSSRKMA